MWIHVCWQNIEKAWHVHVNLNDLHVCNANACWLVLIYNTLIITNVAKTFKYVPYILLYFSVNFLQSTWIRPQNIFQTKILEVTSLVNHHPVNIIISKDKVMLDSQCQVLSHNGMIQYTCKRNVVKVYLWNAIVTKHLALTIWHSNTYWNDNVYWMVIDKCCHLKNLGLEDFLWAYPSTLKKINRKIIIKYMAHI